MHFSLEGCIPFSKTSKNGGFGRGGWGALFHWSLFQFGKSKKRGFVRGGRSAFLHCDIFQFGRSKKTVASVEGGGMLCFIGVYSSLQNVKNGPSRN